MNVLHMKYAVEVAKKGSLNKAAETLLVAQPNLNILDMLRDYMILSTIIHMLKTKNGMQKMVLGKNLAKEHLLCHSVPHMEQNQRLKQVK